MSKAKDKTVISKLYDYFDPKGEDCYGKDFFSGKDYTPEDVLSFILGEASPDKAYSISAGMKKNRRFRMAVYGLDRHRDRHLGLPLPPEYDRKIENYAGEDPPTWDDVTQYIFNNPGLKRMPEVFERKLISFMERPIVTWRVNRAASYDDGLMRLLRRYGGLHDMDIDTRLLISYLRDTENISVSDIHTEYFQVREIAMDPESSSLFRSLTKEYVSMVNRSPILPGGARCMDERYNLSFMDAELGDIACERFILERYFDREEIDAAAAPLAPNSAMAYEEQSGFRGYSTAHPVGRLLNRFGAEVTTLENCSYDDFLMLIRRGYPIISFVWSPRHFNWRAKNLERIDIATDPGLYINKFHQSCAQRPFSMSGPSVSCVLIFPAWCKLWYWGDSNRFGVSPLVYVPREGLTDPFSMVDKNFIDPSFCSDARTALIRPAVGYYDGYEQIFDEYCDGSDDDFKLINERLDIDFSRLVIFRPPKSWKAKKWDFTPRSVAYHYRDTDFRPRLFRRRESCGKEYYDYYDNYYKILGKPSDRLVRHPLRLFDVEPRSLRKETIPGGISGKDVGRFRLLTGQTESEDRESSSDE